jgi:hypothetical protein
MAWSPYKYTVIDYVRRNPGCCKYDVARHVARRCNPSKLYYIVNTAIRNGWIVSGGRNGNRYELYPSEDEKTQDEKAIN